MNDWSQRSEMLKREIADLEEMVRSGVKLQPAGGAHDSANEEYAKGMEKVLKALLETKKGELHFLNVSSENWNKSKQR